MEGRFGMQKVSSRRYTRCGIGCKRCEGCRGMQESRAMCGIKKVQRVEEEGI